MTNEFPNRDEITSGAVGRVRRARALVFLIEEEAKRNRARQEALSASVLPEIGATVTLIMSSDPELMRGALPGEGDQAYIDSFRNARRRSGRAKVRTLDSTWRMWKVLIPESLSLRAEVLNQLSMRHDLPRNKTKGIAKAFEVGTEAFDQAFLRTIGTPVETVFSESSGFLSRFVRR